MRDQILQKYNGHCAYCGCKITLKTMQVDHIVPKSNFVSSIKNNFRIPVFLKHLTEFDCEHIDNKNPSCRVCNNWKNAMDLEYFRGELSKQVERLNLRSASYRMAKKYGQIEEIPKPIVFYFETMLYNIYKQPLKSK